MTRIVLFGCPRPIGGANTEAGDTALLWRKLGYKVSVLPIEEESPDNPWPDRLAKAGCRIAVPCERDRLPVPMMGCIVVDFAVERAARLWDLMARSGNRLIHVPCMVQPFHHEQEAFRHRPPTALVYQSDFQRRKLELQYTAWGVPQERQQLIHGAFDREGYIFPPPPREPGQAFVVGHLARPVGCKWPRRLWPILEAAKQTAPVEGDVMGWVPEMERFACAPPAWVTCQVPGALPVPEYLKGLHCLLCTGDCDENWSRVVLEAFAAGVAVIADNRGGYREQIRDGETGLLCETPEQMASAIVWLANNEPCRLGIIERARKALGDLADPETIGGQWQKLFSEIRA